MLPVEFQKTPCHPLEFKDQGPLFGPPRNRYEKRPVMAGYEHVEQSSISQDCQC